MLYCNPLKFYFDTILCLITVVLPILYIIDDTVIFILSGRSEEMSLVIAAAVNSTKGPDKRTIEEAEGLSNAVVVIMFEPKR